MSEFPVSVKGVVVRDGRVLLLRNERSEWELPGGRLEPCETPQDCVAREVAEETQWSALVGPILDAWTYHVEVVGRSVFVVTYGCTTDAGTPPIRSAEHNDIGLFRHDEVAGLPMPDGYRRSIADWYERHG